MTVIFKKIKLRNILLCAFVLINLVLFTFIGECTDFNTISAMNSSVNEQYPTFQKDNAEVKWWKASISEYNMESSVDVQEITTQEILPQIEKNTEDNLVADVQDEYLHYADETFTVYDLNTDKYVTLNGYDLVCQIVRNEVGAHYTSGAKSGQTAYHKEAIKAFAVAAYSYVKYCKNTGQTASVGLNCDISDALRSYVSEVDGKAIYYDGEVICAMYCASTGGRTLSSKYSWGKDNPYLVSVESKYDNQGRQYKSETAISESEMKSIIESKTDIVLSDNPENWLKIVSTVDGSYVDKMIIDGHSTCKIYGKDYELTGSFFRNKIMQSRIKSPDFTFYYKDGYFYFTVYGFGHGVGMPAEGANLYAIIENYTYFDILNHYYTNVIIK